MFFFCLFVSFPPFPSLFETSPLEISVGHNKFRYEGGHNIEQTYRVSGPTINDQRSTIWDSPDSPPESPALMQSRLRILRTPYYVLR
ncbi:hypothetical protein L228DRAFT_245111 [Xylona heveae TC161]|uniref:Uncharacterized protein n=1 Tax=Xylona heveae (strain CBS 132557 / TC161) TaxID=1328760 RepID=A0A165I177_XYLHT|nr:hypothetical protein L228DRAFT_245111 [Xylona heveae TC161]KZF24211.1 hypothetical protein L228DRAFT_245111 [Xylona heveae TC161]